MTICDDGGPGPRGTDISSDPDRGSDIVDGIKGMLSFFTIFRLNVGEREISAMERNFRFVPVIGFIVGLIASLTGLVLVWLGFSNIVVVVSILAVLFILTKFLHFDGLTDFGDGVIASGPREVHIRALKDTHIGAGGFGVALTVTLLSFALMSDVSRLTSIILVIWPLEVMVKNAMVSAAAFGVPGDGMAANQVRKTGSRSLAVSCVLSLVLSSVAVILMGFLLRCMGWIWPLDFLHVVFVMFAALIASVFAGWMMAKIANSQFGFVNGDILGATNEVSRPLILFVVIALIVVGLG